MSDEGYLALTSTKTIYVPCRELPVDWTIETWSAGLPACGIHSECGGLGQSLGIVGSDGVDENRGLPQSAGVVPFGRPGFSGLFGVGESAGVLALPSGSRGALEWTHLIRVRLFLAVVHQVGAWLLGYPAGTAT